MNDKIQEQVTEIYENESNENQLATNVNENNADNISNEDETGPVKVSIGVGRDARSAIRTKQQTITTTIGDECEYVGNIYADKKHGEGILTWSDGRIYKGAFFADKRHGFGTFQTSNLLEFKGLYRNDERFGPGILIYKSIQSADVGFWLSEHLVRLLYPHPMLNFDIHITDKKPPSDSSCIIPSWYSPQELLSTSIDLDSILKKKSSALFCQNIEDENSSLTRYIIEHSDRLDEAMHERYTQVDAYLESLNNDNDILKEKISNERIADISLPNETYEQRQLYYYTNKFWPLKQRATFSIDEILSNTRSSFPNSGPLENSSLSLFESAFNGEIKTVRDLLMHRQVYVDVCDSRGLTALHFATYNIHINVVNLLLDFGANVNQLSDDGLTSLTIAFLLYYGNDPQQTINIALEHVDPIVLTPKSISVADIRRSNSKDRILLSRATTNTPRNLISRASTINEDKFVSSSESIKINDIDKKNSYGYEFSDKLHERLQDENFRESVYSLIKLLLRRGANPSLSDWPLPVLALAVRAGDKDMVELLLKKKAQVNCRLNTVRHASLTPLHIACGCLSSNAIDIVRQLLEHGAHVNAESLPGGQEYLSLADPSVIDIHRINDSVPHGRTPLHIACTREITEDTLSLVRLLLEYHANPNVVCNGQTPLSLAITLGNERLIDLLINHETTDPSTSLGLGNGNVLCTILSTVQEPRWTYAKRLELIERLIAKNPKVLYPIRFGPKHTLGSSVDYAYYSFLADARISQTPYHSLTPQERIIYKERKELLAYIAKRFREEVTKRENFLRLPTPVTEYPSRTPSVAMFVPRTISRSRSFMTERSVDITSKISNEFHYCATCGRSTGVRLTLCKRCQLVYFCSKACKVAGWNAFHRHECQIVNQISEGDRPITTSKTVSSKNKLPSLRPSTQQTDLTQFQSAINSGTRAENYTALDGALFKENVLSIKTPPHITNNSRLPSLSVSKLIRQKRLKKVGKSGENLPPTLPAYLEGIHLSWNSMYNAPENYSFN
ncbi:unnamed protein product [Rotaria sordida]|uniref:MYND-type domain-containing protein n=1 Tax=Rotaria sordida TaxID=392033 RepID=A0A814HCY5_9BILA|nr:unnamed protein product [Rotaria sordida]CAF3739468.1 unnamed protein product [Rotaria sordida]